VAAGIRVLYDTNVLAQVTARRGRGLQFRALLAGGDITHLTSRYVLDETEAVLVERFGATRQKARASVRLIAKFSVVVEPARIEQVSRDPNDDAVLAAAAAGHARYLVTADKDLLVLGEYRSVQIVSPADFEAADWRAAAG